MEIVIGLALSVLILAILGLATIRYYRNRELSSTANTLVSYLRTASSRASHSKNGASHGVSTANSRLVLFQGGSYASRSVPFDTVLPYSSNITFTGLSEVVFAQQTGLPNATGTITLSDGVTSASVIVNSTGLIFRQ